jgi:hypothetical protein
MTDTDSKTILYRALQMIEDNTPPYEWSDHGECCPVCALAVAITDWEFENDIPMDNNLLAPILARSYLRAQILPDEVLDLIDRNRAIQILENALADSYD